MLDRMWRLQHTSRGPRINNSGESDALPRSASHPDRAAAESRCLGLPDNAHDRIVATVEFNFRLHGWPADARSAWKEKDYAATERAGRGLSSGRERRSPAAKAEADRRRMFEIVRAVSVMHNARATKRVWR